MTDPSDRRILRISGRDAEAFLQGLVTNDVKKARAGLVYAALLTPQGKYLADFFLLRDGDDILVDVAEAAAEGLAQRLTMYKLRADVTIADTDLRVARGLGPAPQGALPDPRHPALGWRAYGARAEDDGIDWDAVRVAHGIPETGIELVANDSYPLEVGFERLGGVDFRKGCYVGQEVTARMKHKTDLRKGLATVAIEGNAPVGTPIVRDGKEAGTLFTQSGGEALAYLRFDRAGVDMTAGEATVHWHG